VSTTTQTTEQPRRNRTRPYIAGAAGLAIAAAATTGIILATTGDNSPRTPPGAQTSTSQPATQSGAPNPVDLLRKIPGIQLPAGTSVGNLDIAGDRYAPGHLPSMGTVEDVTVYTNVSDAALQLPMQASTDSNKLIVGPKFYAVYTGVMGNDGMTFSVDPAQMASWLGGQLR
jgi:hypothetical protein